MELGVKDSTTGASHPLSTFILKAIVGSLSNESS